MLPTHILAQANFVEKELSTSPEKPLNDSVIALADMGDRDAQFRLGLYYDSIDSSKESNRRSMYWYVEAAKQGYLGSIQFRGEVYAW